MTGQQGMPQFVLLWGAAQWKVLILCRDIMVNPVELLFNTVGSHFLVLHLKYFQIRKKGAGIAQSV
jgi:hypothetical protein